MNKKGFTLIELLSVFLIICLVVILSFPIVNSIIVKSKNSTYFKQIDTILNASYDWSLKNLSLLPDRNEKFFITLSELKQRGFIDNNITNPITKELFPNDLVISISNVGNNYKKNDNYSKTNGEYLFKVEKSFMELDKYKKNKPIIFFDNFDYNKDDKYFFKINIGDEFSNFKYTATTKDKSIDLSSRVIENINFNGNIIDYVDTSKYGVYNIYYTVIDDNGYSSTAVINLVVTDEEPPVITIDNNITLSTSINNVNLLDGVSCTDNSNSCDITVVEDIEYGKKGKYVVEYIAHDPTGNTSSKKRILTIE